MLQKLVNELSPIRAKPVLNDGASLKKIHWAEKTMGIDFPGPLKQLYLEADGEDFSGNLQLPNPVSLFIDFEFYDLEAAVSAYKVMSSIMRCRKGLRELLESLMGSTPTLCFVVGEQQNNMGRARF